MHLNMNIKRRRTMPTRSCRIIVSLAVGISASIIGVGSTSVASAASVPGVSGKTIHIGIAYPTTGAVAIYSNKFKATQYYLRYLNNHGGVNGYKFAFAAENNECTSVGGATAVRELLSSRPFLILTSCSDSFSGAISALKSEAPNTPVIEDGNSSLIKPSGLKYVYGTSPNYILDCEYLIRYGVESLHFSRFGILYDEGPNGAPAARPCGAYGKSVGAKSVSLLGIPADTSDYSGLAAKIASSGAQAWIAFCLISDESATIKAAVSDGYKGTWLTQSSNFSYQLVHDAGSAINNSYISSYILPPHTAHTAAAELFKKVVDPVDPKVWGVLGGQGWSAGYLIAYAVREATANGQPLTQAGFANALGGIHDLTMGIMPHLTYKNGNARFASAVHEEAMYKIENGEYVQVGPYEPLPRVVG